MNKAIVIRNMYIEDVSGNRVFEPIDFEIGRGETVLIYGDCGSGKSLILKSIAGIVQAMYPGLKVYGDIYVYGYRPIEALERGYTIYIPQDISLAMLTTSLLEELDFYGIDIDSNILRVLNVEKIAMKPINILSAGERYRVMLALALHLGKKIILIDEPSAYIDSISMPKIVFELKRYARENNITIVFADHRKDLFGDHIDFYIELKDKTICRVVEPGNDDGNSNMIIRFNNVSFSYRDREIIRDLSIDIWRGDIVAIVGSNGSGKTTLIKLMLGLLKPRRGRIEKLYRDAFYIPQLASYWIVGKDLISILKEFSIDEKILMYTGLWEKHSFTPYSLSLGEVRRFSIYMAMYSNRDVVFIDEVLLGLDIKSIECIKSLFEWIRKKKIKTVIFSTHDKNLAYGFRPTKVIDLDKDYS